MSFDGAERGLCVGAPADLWFGPGDVDSSTAEAYKRQGLEICRRCPVSLECDRYATTARERHGVWGGINRTASRPVMARQRELMVQIWAETRPDTLPVTAESEGNGRLVSLPMPTRRLTLPEAKRGRQPQHGNQRSYRRGCRCDDCVNGEKQRRAAEVARRNARQRARRAAARDDLAELRAERARRDDQRRNAAGEAWA